MDFLKHPAWQVFLAVVAIIVSVFIYIDQRPVRRLKVDVLSNNPLVSVNSDIANEIQILYKGSPVQSLSLILLKIANAGNQPITSNDFNTPLRVVLSEESEIAEVVVQDTNPKNIQMTPSISMKNEITFSKTLLNPGDQVVVRILAINNDGSLDINARITGISNIDIQSVVDNERKQNINSIWGLVLAIVIFIGPYILFGIWESKTIIMFRKKFWNFDPGQYYYTRARNFLWKGTLTFERKKQTVDLLRKSFSWDSDCLDIATNDHLLEPLNNFEPYKELIKEFSQKKI